ncbi:MAG: hypothetical protein U1F83_17610 [Verrucomicrobiota bacterium]
MPFEFRGSSSEGMTVHRPRRVVQVNPLQHLAIEELLVRTFEPAPVAGQRRVGLAVMANRDFKQIGLAPEDRQALRLVAAFGQMAEEGVGRVTD